MELGIIAVTFIRSSIGLLILKFPLFGGVASIVADYFDFELLRFLGTDLVNYQTMDKVLDMYYLSLEACVVLSFKNLLVKRVALSLFAYRFFGFLLFLVFNKGIILVIFPNLFEFFYIFYLSFKKLHKFDPVTSVKRLLVILFLLLLPKLYYEYMLHVNTTYPWTENKYVKLIFK